MLMYCKAVHETVNQALYLQTVLLQQTSDRKEVIFILAAVREQERLIA